MKNKTDEQIKDINDKKRRCGSDNGFYGKHHNNKTKEIIGKKCKENKQYLKAIEFNKSKKGKEYISKKALERMAIKVGFKTNEEFINYINNEYFSKNKTITEISKLLKCSRTTIRKRIKKRR